jgi:hypothetical protein
MSDLPTLRSGRYAGIPVATYTGADQRPIVYLTRRFVPQPGQLVLVKEHAVRPGERLDHIAANHFGDPELFWRICDANRATDPSLLEVPGRRLRITLALEMSLSGPGAIDA